MTIVMEGLYPRHCMLVDGVQEGAINVKDDGLRRISLMTNHAMKKRPKLETLPCALTPLASNT
jgi:hypothetical protein